MMLIKNGDRFICIATVLEVSDGTGRAARWKAIATMEIAMQRNGVIQKKDINVAFWNAKDLTRPQMADRCRKLQKGERIMALIAADDKEYSCLAFARKEGVLSLNCQGKEYYCGFGYVYHNRSTEKAYQIAIPFHFKDHVKWNQVGFPTNEGHRESAEKVKSGRCVFIADAKIDFTKKDGSKGTKYHGVRLWQVPENAMDDIKIDIGVYKDSPTRLGELIRKAKYDPDVMYWMRYVAEKWQPEAGKEGQKKAIKEYLDSVA